MKIKLLILLICYMVLNLSPFITLHGQTVRTDLPYNIDIKKNTNNIKSINLSSIGKELTYIPLETKPECLIQKIRKVEFTDSDIFVSEFTRLLQFDKNGKFIRQIGSAGRGPEEYSYVEDFCIDEQKKEIYIISINTPMVWVFGFDGTFIKSLKLTYRPAQIIPKDQNSLMYHLANVPGKNDPSWIITNSQGITSTSIKNNLRRISQPGLIVPESPLYSYDNTLHFMEFGIDTLYYFKERQKKPYAVFYLGDLKMDPDPLITDSMVKNHEFQADKLSVISINENDAFLFIKFSRGMSDLRMYAIYDKKMDTVTFLKDDVFKNDLGGGVGFWPKQIVNDKILVDYVDAFDLLKKIIPSTLRSKISETSNPVLMILK